MAGKITVSTINDSSGVLATQNGMTGIAKAWVNINGASGASPTIRASFNVSSVTRNGTGYYTVTFTTAMADTNYSSVVTSTGNLGSGANTFPFGVAINAQNSSGTMTEVAPTTSAFTFQTAVQSGNYDSKYVNVVVCSS
jgi:hypothetical protein